MRCKTVGKRSYSMLKVEGWTFRKSTEVAECIGEPANAWHDGRAWTEDREYIEKDLKNQKEIEEWNKQEESIVRPCGTAYWR